MNLSRDTRYRACYRVNHKYNFVERKYEIRRDGKQKILKNSKKNNDKKPETFTFTVYRTEVETGVNFLSQWNTDVVM